MPHAETEFKNNPMIALAQDEQDRYPFQFGLRKARLIVDNIQGIQEFVEKYEQPEPPKEEKKGKGKK